VRHQGVPARVSCRADAVQRWMLAGLSVRLDREVAARLLPAIAPSAPTQTTENLICRASGETGATGLEPATSGMTGRSRRLREGWGQAGFPAVSRPFQPLRGGDSRVRAGASGSLVRDERGMRSLSSWQTERCAPDAAAGSLPPAIEPGLSAARRSASAGSSHCAPLRRSVQPRFDAIPRFCTTLPPHRYPSLRHLWR
jgi:hypothetical protein